MGEEPGAGVRPESVAEAALEEAKMADGAGPDRGGLDVEQLARCRRIEGEHRLHGSARRVRIIKNVTVPRMPDMMTKNVHDRVAPLAKNSDLSKFIL